MSAASSSNTGTSTSNPPTGTGASAQAEIDRSFATTRRAAKPDPGGAPQIPQSWRSGGLRTRGWGKERGDDRPLISVIIPVFRGAETLEACLQSVQRQRYDSLELLVMDGGSDDRTVEILKAHDGGIDLWISAPDEGVYDAMNRGVDLARGDWLYFLGSDDILVDCLHRLAPHLQNPRTIYHGDVYKPLSNVVQGGALRPEQMAGRNLCHQGIFYPRAVFAKRRYDPRYRLYADWALNISCWADPALETRYLPLLIAVFAETGLTSVGEMERDSVFLAEKEALVERHLGDRLRRQRRRRGARRRLVGALDALGLGPLLRRWLGREES
ncbi:MAG: glycosyltransferase family 2 protein [Acidobacteriota bacterium]